MDERSAAQLLSDPNLSAEDLATVAYHFPTLWAQVTAHPSAYPELIVWISEQQGVLQQEALQQVPLQQEPIREAPLEQAPLQQAAFQQEVGEPQAHEIPAPEKLPPLQPKELLAGGKPERSLGKVIGVVAGSMVAVLMLIGGIWWITQDAGESGGDLGTEQAIEAGLQRAAKLSGDSEEIASHQEVYAPSLFAYSNVGEGSATAASGALYPPDQILLKLSGNADFGSVEKAAEEAGATIVGVNERVGCYQLLLTGSTGSSDAGGAMDLGDAIDLVKTVEGVEDVTANFGLMVSSPSNEPKTSDTGESGGEVTRSPLASHYEDEVGLAEITVGVVDGGGHEAGAAEEPAGTVEGLAPNAKVLIPAGSGMSEGESVDVYSLANSLTYLIEQSDRPVVIAAPSLVGFVEAELEEAAITLGDQLVALVEGGAPDFLFVVPPLKGCEGDAEDHEECAEPADPDVWEFLEEMYPNELGGKVLRALGRSTPLTLSADAAVVWGVNPTLSGEQVAEIFVGVGDFDLPAAMQLAVATKGLEGEDATTRITDLQSVDIPLNLQGAWCPADQLNTKASGCLNFLELLGPDAVFETVEGGGEGESWTVLVCVSGDCEEGEELTFAYYPPGTPWECVEDGEATGCDSASVEEMTQADEGKIAPHETSWPRIVQRYMDGDNPVQGTPLLLNLQAEGDYTDLPEAVFADAKPWQTGGVGGWQPEYQMTSFRSDWSDPLTVLVTKKGEPGAQLYYVETDDLGRAEGPHPALEDLGEIVWLTEGAAVNAEGEAYAWETDMSSTFFGGTIHSPISINNELDIDKPIAQVEFLLCFLCQEDADDPIPRAVAVLYQDGTAELFDDEGGRQPLGPSGHIASMTASVHASVTFVMSNGEVQVSFFGESPEKVDFGGADVAYACGSGGETFAVTGSGELLATNDFGQKSSSPLELPGGETVSQIDCTPFTTSSSRHPVFEPRVFVLTTEGEVLQYARPFLADGPAWNPLAGPGMVAVDDYMILSEDGRVLFTETPGYEGLAEVVH